MSPSVPPHTHIAQAPLFPSTCHCLSVDDALQPGREMIAAGYVLYSSAVVMALSTGTGESFASVWAMRVCVFKRAGLPLRRARQLTRPSSQA